jgi:hypothetical protein
MTKFVGDLRQVGGFLRMIKITDGLVLFMVINATFNNISVISWRSVLLVEEI